MVLMLLIDSLHCISDFDSMEWKNMETTGRLFKNLLSRKVLNEKCSVTLIHPIWKESKLIPLYIAFFDWITFQENHI